MRIAYFADIRFPLERANGIQTMETCAALARRGHAVDLIVRPDTHTPARDPFAYYGMQPERTLRIERAPAAGPPAARRLGYLAFAAGRALGRSRADLSMTRDLGVASLLLGIPGAIRAPLIYESHGYAPDVAEALPGLVATATAASPGKLRRLARREAAVWQRAEGYVTITRALADELQRRHGSRERVAIVPDGVRLDRPPAEFRHAGTPPVVGYAGHLYVWKGVDVLLEALARIPDVRGLIAGGHAEEPDLARIQQQAERLGLAGRITFTGLLDPARVPELLAAADVLALPNPASAISTRFTSPLKLFEYMAAARPIVATDLPAIREVLVDGVNAVLVRPGDPAALADGIRRVLDDPPLAEAIARRALEAVPEYSWDRRAERLEALFDEVAAATR